MDTLPQYWKIYRLPSLGNSPNASHKGYDYWHSVPAECAFKSLLSNHNSLRQGVTAGDKHIQQTLLELFLEKSVSNEDQASAGLCLRCYISSSILYSCQKLASACAGSSNYIQLFQDLLVAALDDDGETLFILDNSKKPLPLKLLSTPELPFHSFISLDILRGYNHCKPGRKSLKNWAYYTMPRNQIIKKILNQHGINRVSDWAQMNRAKPAQLELLSPRERQHVTVFHRVYRRDRIRQSQQTSQISPKCLPPTLEQLKEMMLLLKKSNLKTSTPKNHLEELQQIAKKLQDLELSRVQGRPNIEPIELPDPETGEATRDICSSVVNDPVAQEYEEILTFLRQQQFYALQYGIQQGIDDRLTKLNTGKQKKYTSKLLLGLRLIYCEGKSLRDIWEYLDFPNYTAASRVLSLKELIHQVRFRMSEKLLDIILVRSHEMGLTSIPPKPDYLSNLVKNIELLCDEEFFDFAFQELKNPKKGKDSVYAKELYNYLKKI